MLGRNMGICETLEGINPLLHRCEPLLNPGGQLLVNSVDDSVSPEAADGQGYPGEREFRLFHAGNVGPWMRWLHVDFETLASHALDCGWSMEKLVGTAEGEFLARLQTGR